MNCLLAFLLASLQIPQAEPKITFEVTGQKVTESEGRKVTEKIKSLEDIEVQSSGIGRLRAEFQTSVKMIIDWDSAPPAHRNRFVLVRTWLAAKESSMLDQRVSFVLPDNTTVSGKERDAFSSVVVELPANLRRAVIPLKLSAKATGLGSRTYGSGHVEPLASKGTLDCRGAVLAALLPSGSLTEKAALAGRLSVMRYPSVRVQKAAKAFNPGAPFNPTSSGRAYRTASESELNSKQIDGIEIVNFSLFKGGLVLDGVSALIQQADLRRLAAGFWGPHWAEAYPGSTLRLRNLWTERWAYPLARLTQEVSKKDGVSSLDFSATRDGWQRLCHMKPALGLPPVFSQTEAEMKSGAWGTVGYPLKNWRKEMTTVQLYGVKRVYHCSGTLEALDSKGRVLKADRIVWRSNWQKSLTNSTAVMKLVGSYSGGPFFQVEEIR